jgi:hypothetical protein
MAKEEYIEVGVWGTRNPVTHEFGESFPIFMRATDEAIAGRDEVTRKLGHIFAMMLREQEGRGKGGALV